jgi:ribose transport system substrate-binding protein
MNLLRPAATAALLACLAALPACKGGGSGGETHGSYRVLDTFTDNVDRKKAKENATDVLSKYAGEPNLCLVGLWAYNPPAILSAVKDKNKGGGQVKIVGFDEDEATLHGIAEGDVYATVVQDPYGFGYESVQMMARLIKGDESTLPQGGIKSVPHRVIKKDNVATFEAELKDRMKPQPAPEPNAGRPTVALVSNNSEMFWTICEAGARAAERDLKDKPDLAVNVVFQRPSNATVAEQKQIIDDLVSKGVKAIAVSVINPENQAAHLNSVAERIPLITQDNDAPNTKRRCYIGTDNVKAGREVGRLIKQAMPQGGAIAIFVGQLEPLNARQRRQGVLDELDGKPE